MYFFVAVKSGYQRDRFFEEFENFCRDSLIVSYKIQEVYGAFDLILRVWFPSRRFNALAESIKVWLTKRSPNIDVINVSDCSYHWLWDDESEEPNGGPSRTDMEDLLPKVKNGALDDAEFVDGLKAKGVLRVMDKPKPAIRFLIAISPPSAQISNDAGNTLIDKVRQEVLKTNGLQHVEIYVSDSNTWIIIEASVRFPNYGSISKLVSKLQISGLRDWDCRTTTFICCDNVLGSKEIDFISTELQESARETDRDDLIKFLGMHEGINLEIKGSWRIDIVNYLNTGTIKILPEMTDKILQTISAFLNTAGGTIVIGALEPERVKKILNKELPKVGKHLICGVDPDQLKKGGFDAIQRTVTQSVRSKISATAAQIVSVKEYEIEDRILGVIDVPKLNTISYFGDEFYVREGATTRRLTAKEIEEFRRDP